MLPAGRSTLARLKVTPSEGNLEWGQDPAKPDDPLPLEKPIPRVELAAIVHLAALLPACQITSRPVSKVHSLGPEVLFLERRLPSAHFAVQDGVRR